MKVRVIESRKNYDINETIYGLLRRDRVNFIITPKIDVNIICKFGTTYVHKKDDYYELYLSDGYVCFTKNPYIHHGEVVIYHTYYFEDLNNLENVSEHIIIL